MRRRRVFVLSAIAFPPNLLVDRAEAGILARGTLVSQLAQQGRMGLRSLSLEFPADVGANLHIGHRTPVVHRQRRLRIEKFSINPLEIRQSGNGSRFSDDFSRHANIERASYATYRTLDTGVAGNREAVQFAEALIKPFWRTKGDSQLAIDLDGMFDATKPLSEIRRQARAIANHMVQHPQLVA